MINFSQYKIIVIFVLICFAPIGKIYSQLSIKEHTKVHIDTSFTSLESRNIINSDVNGKGQLIFNSAHAQELNTAHLISLPNITINTSSSFTFKTPIEIDGDLTLNANFVTIQSPIHLKGKLQVADDTTILGKENIHLQTQIQTQPFPLSNKHQTIDITIGVQHLKHTNTPTNQNSKKTKYYYKNIATYLLAVKTSKIPI